VEQTYFCGRKEYGVLQVAQAKDMATRPIDWQAPIKKLVTTISH
jgi:hypothetical protein